MSEESWGETVSSPHGESQRRAAAESVSLQNANMHREHCLQKQGCVPPLQPLLRARTPDVLHHRARRQPSRTAPRSLRSVWAPGSSQLTSAVQSTAGRPSRRLHKPALHRQAGHLTLQTAWRGLVGICAGRGLGGVGDRVGDLCRVEAWVESGIMLGRGLGLETETLALPEPKRTCPRSVGALRLRGNAGRACLRVVHEGVGQLRLRGKAGGGLGSTPGSS